MTNYKDFEINRKNGNSSNGNERSLTNMDCLSDIFSEIISETIKNCEYTAGSGCTGCCNSQKNCPGSTGRRK
ncbi:hypothetical protein [Peptacetobacter sp. AB800]|uniref:hypothetical protein n=1 Tax=Peptacetobacter sp. AB800 TaxID=3388428 RepID=UPI0039FC5FF0